jgi:preprotein translocase subunit SecD
MIVIYEITERSTLKMSKSKKVTILIISILVLLIVIVGIFSFTIGKKLIRTYFTIPESENERVEIILSPSEGNKPSGKELATAKLILTRRFEGTDIFYTTITMDGDTFVLDIPLLNKQNKEFVTEIVNKITEVSYFTVQEVEEDKIDSSGKYLPTNKIIIDGMDVTNASVHKSNEKPDVYMELTKDAGLQFEEATDRLIGRPMSIFMDDRFIAAPVVQAKISDGSFSIGGFNDVDDALLFVNLIKSGPLPYKLEIKEIK